MYNRSERGGKGRCRVVCVLGRQGKERQSRREGSQAMFMRIWSRKVNDGWRVAGGPGRGRGWVGGGSLATAPATMTVSTYASRCENKSRRDQFGFAATPPPTRKQQHAPSASRQRHAATPSHQWRPCAPCGVLRWQAVQSRGGDRGGWRSQAAICIRAWVGMYMRSGGLFRCVWCGMQAGGGVHGRGWCSQRATLCSSCSSRSGWAPRDAVRTARRTGAGERQPARR